MSNVSILEHLKVLVQSFYSSSHVPLCNCCPKIYQSLDGWFETVFRRCARKLTQSYLRLKRKHLGKLQRNHGYHIQSHQTAYSQLCRQNRFTEIESQKLATTQESAKWLFENYYWLSYHHKRRPSPPRDEDPTLKSHYSHDRSTIHVQMLPLETEQEHQKSIITKYQAGLSQIPHRPTAAGRPGVEQENWTSSLLTKPSRNTAQREFSTTNLKPPPRRR